MMELLCVLKCLIDGMTYHLLFYQERRKENSLRENLKNIGTFLLLLLMAIFPTSFVLPGILLSFFTIMLVTVYFYIQNKRLIRLLVILAALTLFYSVLLLSSFGASSIVGIGLMIFHSKKIVSDPFLKQIIVVSVYLIFCLILVFSKKMPIKTIKKMMEMQGIPFIIALVWAVIILAYIYFVFRPIDYGSRVILIPIMFLGLFLIFRMIKLAYEIHERNNARIAALQQVKGKSLDELRNENPKIWDALYEYFTVDLQISSGMKGFHQLIVAVLFVIVGGQKSYNLLRDIYPRVAELTGAKSAKSVAVNITNAIESIWGNAENAEHLAEVYPYPVSSKTGMPTNKEFIFCVADRMKKQLQLEENSETLELTTVF